jgi:hypothetical protein
MMVQFFLNKLIRQWNQDFWQTDNINREFRRVTVQERFDQRHLLVTLWTRSFWGNDKMKG